MRQYYWLSNPASEADLEKLRLQHQLILNAIGEGVYGVDCAGRATFVNPAAAAMIGWSIEELVGQSMHAVLHHSYLDGSPYPASECPIYAAFQDGVVHQVNHEVFWRRDGTSFPVEYVSTPMHDEQGQLIGAVVAFRDITQRKWAEAILQQTNEELERKVRERTAELQQLNQQLQELNELKSRLVAMVCHEFRNPLNNVLLSASYLDRYESQLSETQKGKHLADIQANVERMTRIIDDILAIEKMATHPVETPLMQLNVVDFCQDLIAEMRPLLGDRLITLRSEKIPTSVTIDERLLRPILTNILANAIHYSPNQSAIHMIVAAQPEWLIFTIKDTGIGISPEDLPRLFDPFHRGKNVSNIPGTGLGLSIVKKFVDLQQGKVEVQSQVGKGTIFTVWLPIIRSPQTGT
jgi:PAS domain S-box-containing protein